jgi:hypothetical protein
MAQIADSLPSKHKALSKLKAQYCININNK